MESVPVEDRELQGIDQNTRHDSSDGDISRKGKRVFFRTRSLAEVYAQQGHISMALEIYRRIQQRDPSDQEIAERIAELEASLGSRRGARSKPDRSSQEDSTE